MSGSPNEQTSTIDYPFVESQIESNGELSVDVAAHFLNDTATTAGGATTAGIRMGSAEVGFYWGSGAPTISAAKGSIYSRTDGSSTSTRLYVNTDGATTWTNVTTAA